MTQLFDTTGWSRGAIITSAQSAPSAVSTTLPSGTIVTEGYRGLRIMVIGDTSNDDVDVTLYGIERSSDGKTFLSQAFTANDSVLIGTTAGVADGFVTEGELLADTYPALSTTTYGTKILNYVSGTIDVFSPGSNGVGCYLISDVGNLYGVLPIIDTANTGDYFSFAWHLDR